MPPTRTEMLETHLKARGISDPRVLAAMAAVPRDQFVPDAYRDDAFADRPLPIGFGQTISQPYIVAWMTQALGVVAGMRVLEIGAGCGYQTAILAELGADVYSLEIVSDLAQCARATLDRLGYGNARVREGSGYAGWPEAAPFDRILLTAAPPEVPPALIEQLADAERLVAPVGIDDQVIVVIERHGDRTTRRESIAVRFVPMV